MKAIPFSELLQEVCDLVGWDGSSLTAQEFAQARRAIGSALSNCWRYTFWPDTMRTERRTFHPEYDSTLEVEEGEFRYFPPTDAYYQALQTQTGEAPATIVGGQWETNLEFWSLAVRALTASDWSATTTYRRGDKVYYATNFKFYQAYDDPPLATNPLNIAYWTEVNELDPVIPWTETGWNPIGLVEGVYASNPNSRRGALPLAWDETANGIQMREDEVNAPWVRYQLRPPILTGAIWSSTGTYDAVSVEDEVIASPPVARGDYPSFETIGEARAATILATRVDVLRDGNLAAATFWRDATYVDDASDVTGFVDAAGTAFRRVQTT